MKDLTSLFDLLTDWRQLPAYQLERRADIFFALYLEDLLTYCGYFADSDRLTVIPEFPAKQEHMNLSDRIDYLVASDDKIVYVELKTDNHSIRTEQALYLHKIRQKSLSEVFSNIIAIYETTTARAKYKHLIKKLNRWIKYTDTRLVKERCRLKEDAIMKIQSVEVVYILPTPQPIKSEQYEHRCICFETLIKMLNQPRYDDDPIARRFAEALKVWAEYPV
ncbi:MAG: hypothetical protein LUC96_06565 [Alistipes sp.]|uniref:hypothetical protein n=1 Tax=Alistipes sp. TaxID=1872444 RepID=UPI0025C5AAE5|nr:hypothetical protein [Alistipes sp.]MCD8274630.1 hypothetical protein [Alistipes sp.]